MRIDRRHALLTLASRNPQTERRYKLKFSEHKVAKLLTRRAEVVVDLQTQDPGHTNELRLCADGSAIEHTLAAETRYVLDVADKLVKGSTAGPLK